jgi:hypothetical protein
MVPMTLHGLAFVLPAAGRAKPRRNGLLLTFPPFMGLLQGK